MAEDNNNTNTNNDKEDEQEQRFLRMFSKQLADALKAKDEEEAAEIERLKAGSSKKSTASLANKDDTKEWTRLRTAYIELCHDDPRISGGNGDCRRLAKAIIPNQKSSKSKSRLLSPKAAAAKTNTNKLALSSRLVEGILQATSRAEARAISSSSATKTTQSSNNDNKSTTNYTTPQEETESMFSPTITTSEGYAELAFAIFIEGPYRCLHKADNLQTTSNFLGTFQPPPTIDTCAQNNNEGLSAEEKARLVDEATANLVSGMEKMSAVDDTDTTGKQQSNAKGDDGSSSSSEFFHNAKMPTTQLDTDDNDSMQEIFAEESDPDDFDFGPSCTSDVQTIFGQKDDDGDLTFNPLQLSKPSATNQTWEGARKAIYHLLSSASYGKLALGSISSRTWSEGDISEVLADLAFMLLLENKDQVGTSVSASDSLTQTDVSTDEDIVALWDRPLFLLRDRALDKNHGHDALPSYLQLLNALLSNSDEDQNVMSILSSPLKSQTEDCSTLPPATTVGLSSLASLCSSKEITDASSGKMSGASVWSVCPRDEVRKTIMSSLYSLASIVESVRPKKSVIGKANEEQSENSTWIRTAVCIISIIEYITNLQARFDYQPLFEGSGSSRSTTLSESDAKEVSESGLFRELLSLYTTTRPRNETSSSSEDNPNADDVVRMQLLRTLFSLSAQSPELLGRYAVRVPEFINEVHSTTFMEKNLIDGILWTSIGSSLIENKSVATASSKPRLKLRANSKLNAKISSIETTSLAERSLSGFETLCTRSTKALEDMKQLVQRTESLTDEQQKEYNTCKDELSSIKRFSNCLSNCPSATNIWLDSLKNKEESSSKAREYIANLKSTLASLPSFSDEELNTSHPGHKKDDDDNRKGSEVNVNEDESEKKSQSLVQIRKEYGAVVASARSSVKVISLALDSKEDSSGLTVKGPSSFDASSKTD